MDLPFFYFMYNFLSEGAWARPHNRLYNLVHSPIFDIFGLGSGLECAPHSSITRDKSMKLRWRRIWAALTTCMIAASSRSFLGCPNTTVLQHSNLRLRCRRNHLRVLEPMWYYRQGQDSNVHVVLPPIWYTGLERIPLKAKVAYPSSLTPMIFTPMYRCR